VVDCVLCLVCWWIVLSSSSLTPSYGLVNRAQRDLGSIRTTIYFDPRIPFQNAGFINTRQTLTTLFLVEVDITTNAIGGSVVICRNAITVPIITGSRGCDSPSNPSLAIEDSNCAITDTEAATNEQILLACYAVKAGSSQAVALGGDVSSCFGDLFVVRQNIQFPVAVEDITNAMLLDSQGIAVVTGMGPRGDVSAVTWLDVILPRLVVQTNGTSVGNNSFCRDAMGAAFDGTYAPFYIDGLDSVILNETRIYAKDTITTYQRLVVQRQPDSTFSLLLSRSNGVGLDFFVTEYAYPNLPINWLDLLPLTNLSFSRNCTVSVSIRALNETAEFNGQLNLVINYPETLTDLDFYENKWPPRYFFTQWCNWHIGRYDSNGQLVYPFAAEGELGGGKVRWKTPGVLGQKIMMNPDVTLADYELDCSTFWPLESTFLGYGDGPNEEGITNGNSYPPFIPESGLCLSPFLDVVAVSNADLIDNEKDLECFKLGGYSYGLSRQACVRPIQKQWCKRGWFYFHQYCYYKFDPIKESKYQVTSTGAAAACQAIFAPAVPLTQLTSDIKTMLQTRFVFYNRVQPGSPFRAPLQGDECLGFDYSTATDNGDSTLDQAVVEVISCDAAAFPICRYHLSDYQVPYSEVIMDVDSVRILRDGQAGVPHPGRQLECSCYDGYGPAGYCTMATCPISSVASNSSLSIWYQKCIANQQGACYDGNPRTCLCYEGFGPTGNYPPTDGLSQYPCACLVSALYEPYISSQNQVNGIYYNITSAQQLICGGSNYGQCIVNPDLNIGSCACANRTLLNPDELIKEQPAYGSSGCAAPIPILPPDGYVLNENIEVVYCNGRGTSCPTGENFAEERPDEESFLLLGRDICFDNHDNSISGCVCQNGWTGLACTCPSPENILKPIVYLSGGIDTTVYSILNIRAPIYTVTVAKCGYMPNQVQLVDDPDDFGSPVTLMYNCSLQVSQSAYQEWNCFGAIGTRILVSSVYSALQCTIQAFQDTFAPCGNNGNPFSGMFYSNEINRDYTFYKDPQVPDFAPFGCTITECMCNPDFTGALCAFGISGFRYDFNENDYYRQICGQGLNPARGTLGDSGEGCECLTREGVTDSVFTGKACELELVNVQGTYEMCGGSTRGFGVNATFPYGDCAFDLADYAADPLSSPFFGITESTVLSETNSSLPYIFTVQALTVLYVDNDGYWLIYPGQRMLLQGLGTYTMNNTIAFDTYSLRSQFPIDMTFVCETVEGSMYPQRAIRFLTLWITVFSCDPHVDIGIPSCYSTQIEEIQEPQTTEQETYPAPFCSTNWAGSAIDYAYTNWAITYECIQSDRFAVDLVNAEEVLETGFYANTRIMQGSLIAANPPQSNGLSFGVFDCSNPFDRTMDDVSFFRGLTSQKQCAGLPIKPHSYVRGEGYGIFIDAIPTLPSFLLPDWISAQYLLIASLLGNNICYMDNVISPRAFDVQTYDEITMTFVDTIPPEVTHNFTSDGTPVTWYSFPQNSTNVSFIGNAYGNPYMYEPFLALLNATKQTTMSSLPTGMFTFGPGGRPGYFSYVPVTDPIRILSLRISFRGMQGIQVYGPTGQLCNMYLADDATNGTFPLGTVLDFECGSILYDQPEPTWESLQRIAQFLGGNNQSYVAALVAQWNAHENEQITIVWSMLNPPVKGSLGSILGATGSPTPPTYSSAPTTEIPSHAPSTSRPSRTPSHTPTHPTTKTPTAPLSAHPSQAPSTSVPSVTPSTSVPSHAPSTSLPSHAPTTPTTYSPTGPTTHIPSQTPVTSIPSSSPSTSAPSISPTVTPDIPTLFTIGDFSYASRSGGYYGVFDAIKTDIFINHQFPSTVASVYTSNCLTRLTGRYLVPFNLTNSDHLAYVKDIWYTFLGPRKCTDTVQCKSFARDANNYQCVFDHDFVVPWRGGDITTADALVGDEGGCVCTQGFAVHPCTICVDGYGPTSWEEQIAYEAFFFGTRGVLPLVDFCSLPWDTTTTRNTPACGGRGNLTTDFYTETGLELHLFENNQTRKCRSVTLFPSGETLNWTASSDYSLDVLNYRGEYTQLDVIQQRVFFNGSEYLISDIPSSNVMDFLQNTPPSAPINVTSLICNGWLTTSTTHFVEFENGVPFWLWIDSQVNFWLSKLSVLDPVYS
jgi:hypothetical protein